MCQSPGSESVREACAGPRPGVYGARVAKRNRKSRRPAGRPRSRRARREPVRDEPDILARITDALDSDDPLPLLALASTLLTVTDPRGRSPLAGLSESPDRDQLIESFLAVPLPETSALLGALAGLSDDDVLSRRVHREITRRAHPLPAWLSDLSRATGEPRAFEMVHALGDGDNVVVAITMPGGHPLTAVVYIDHNMGTVVKDAFVLSEPLDDVVGHVVAAAGSDPDTTARPIDPADARARIGEAVELGAITFPPLETDTWPASRALVQWMAGLLPAGGTGYQRPEWTEQALADLAGRFRASRFAQGVADHGDMLSSLLWFGTDYGPGDPLRWSPVAVEILLTDWVPRKIVAEVDLLTVLPDLVRAFVRFCHHERGVRENLTEQTLAAVDAYEPDYQELIRSDRPQGPAALLAAMGALDDPFPDVSEARLDMLRRAVGGDTALDALDRDPLPDEPFDWATVPPGVHGRVGEVLALLDRCCAELLDTEYRTACRRLLTDVAAGDPDIFRRHGNVATTAAALCWLVGKANPLFDRAGGTGPHIAVKHLTAHFGVGNGAISQRSEPILRAIGVEPHQPHGRKDLGSPRYLTGPGRSAILADRDRYRDMAGPR